MPEKLNKLVNVTELGTIQDLNPVSLILRLLLFVPPNIVPKLVTIELSFRKRCHRLE